MGHVTVLLTADCESGSCLKDGNGDLKERKGLYNQVRNSPVQTSKDSGRACKDVPLPMLPSSDLFPTPKLPQGSC